MQVLAGAVQDGRVDHVDIGIEGGFGLFQVAPQRLQGQFERSSQFFLHPGQGTQITQTIHRLRIARAVHAMPCFW